MSGSRLIYAFGLVVILCEISAILSADVVPVVILRNAESTGSALNVAALQKTSQDEFLELVRSIVGGSRPPIVVFSKDNLCIEDLSREKLNLNDNKLSYLPSVESPIPVFENLESYNISHDEKPESISDGQLVIVPVLNLPDIPDIYQKLRSSNHDLVAFISGLSCSYSRSERTRRAVVTPKADELIEQSDRVLIYVPDGIYVKASSDDSFTLLGTPTNVTTESNGTDNVRMDLIYTNPTSVTLRLYFNATATKYWYFTGVDYVANDVTTALTKNPQIFWPFNFSYHCAHDAVFSNNVTFVNFTGIQVQVDPLLSGDTLVFSDGYDCIGFTTIPIWSGLFITAIFALIFIWAITMIMDIRTMDRFDDPKGKTITIAASE